MALIVVTGPPAAGKTTYIAEHAKPGDIRIDLDHIANTLAGEDMDNHEHAAHILTVAKAARQAAIDTALKQDCTVWLIHTNPTPKQLDDYQALGATVHIIDPGKDVVMKRCKQERPKGSLFAAAKWYDTQTKPTMTIESFAFDKGRPSGGLILDARNLPNPHDIPALRAPNGQSDRVRNWLQQQPEIQNFIQAAIARIDAAHAIHVYIGCSSGKHRSVYIADELAAHYGTTAMHRHLATRKKKPNFRERGYSYHDHDLPRKRLLIALKDGTPCWWCGLPMHKDKKRNWDGWALAADHSNPHGAKNGEQPDRLLHGRCNSQRQDGRYDERRPALTGKHPSEPLAPQTGQQAPPRDRQSEATAAFIWK